MSLKSDFITSLRSTPAGITGFTATVIPALEAFAKPTTVDEAAIAQGVLAYNLNQIFKSFEGLTIVELLLRIGQHSNVAEAMLLSGLEYDEESGGENTIEVQHPGADAIYLPGDLQIIVKEVNGAPKKVTAALEETAITLDGQEGFWVGTITLETAGEYTLQVNAEFDKGDPAAVDVKFSISDDPEEEPEPAEGTDDDAVVASKAAADQAYQDFIKIAAWTADLETLSEKYQAWKKTIQTHVATAQASTDSPAVIDADVALLTNSYARVSTAIQTLSEGTGTLEALLSEAGALQSIVDHIQTIWSTIP